MASLLANGIFGLSPQTTADSSKLPKGFHPKPDSLKFASPKTQTPTRRFKVRADVGIDSRPVGAESGTSAVSSTDKLQQYFQNLDYDKKYGFVEDIDSFTIPKGLTEETIRLISKLKEEPDWMLDFKFKAYAKFLKLEEPKWLNILKVVLLLLMILISFTLLLLSSIVVKELRLSTLVCRIGMLGMKKVKEGFTILQRKNLQRRRKRRERSEKKQKKRKKR